VAGPVSDDAFARYVLDNRIVSPQQVVQARRALSAALAIGVPLTLAETLTRMGALTAAQWANVEKRLQSLPPGITQLGQYKLMRKIGGGAMGEVYLAEDSLAMREVALKLLSPELAADPEFLGRFRREAVAAGKLNHLNLVTAFAFGEDHGRHYYVMEYCPGQPLDVVLARERTLGCERALRVTQDIAGGLGHAHENGIIHRDVKPANIMLTPEGTARLLDLGLSRRRAETDDTAGQAVGTPHYIAPEQARGLDAVVDGRADIYSLGATLYHMLTGRPPFVGEDSRQVMRQHVSAPPPPPQDFRPDLPEGVILLLRRMLAKVPNDRHRDCAELVREIGRLGLVEEPAT
jgi:serine/threonine-protein kinase